MSDYSITLDATTYKRVVVCPCGNVIILGIGTFTGHIKNVRFECYRCGKEHKFSPMAESISYLGSGRIEE